MVDNTNYNWQTITEGGAKGQYVGEHETLVGDIKTTIRAVETAFDTHASDAAAHHDPIVAGDGLAEQSDGTVDVAPGEVGTEEFATSRAGAGQLLGKSGWIDPPDTATDYSAGDGLALSNATFSVDPSEVDADEFATGHAAPGQLLGKSGWVNPLPNIFFVETNDTGSLRTQLQNAQSVDGAIVFVPNGTYQISERLNIGGGTTLWAARGATFERAGGTGQAGLLANYPPGDSPSGYAGDSDIIIRGGTWDGKGDEIKDPMSVFNFRHCENVDVIGATIKNIYSYHGLTFGSVRNCSVDNCNFYGSYNKTTRSGIIQMESGDGFSNPEGGVPCENIRISNCAFYKNPNAQGAAIDSHHTAPPGETFTGLRILDCYIDGYDAGIVLRDVDHPVIDGCEFRNIVTDGIWFNHFADADMQGYSIQNCVFKTIGGCGIRGVESGGDISGVDIRRCDDAAITANVGNQLHKVSDLRISDFYIEHPPDAANPAIDLTLPGGYRIEYCVIQGGTVVYPGGGGGDCINFDYTDLNQVTVDSVHLRGGDRGIVAYHPADSAFFNVNNCTMKEMDREGVVIYSTSGRAYYGFVISNNQFWKCGKGEPNGNSAACCIGLFPSDGVIENVAIMGNIMRGTDQAINAGGSTTTTIPDSVVLGNVTRGVNTFIGGPGFTTSQVGYNVT